MNPTRIIRCPNCGNTIRDNPKKHQDRPKICNSCKKPYTKGFGVWKPNLNWVKEKLRIRDDRVFERQNRRVQRSAASQEASQRMLDQLYRRRSGE